MCTVVVSKKRSCRETSCLQCVLQSLGQIPIQSRRGLNGMQQFVIGKSFERVSLVSRVMLQLMKAYLVI